MPRISIDLNHPDGLAQVNAQWKSAQGYIPGEPNYGMVQGAVGSPARLPDYDDSSWEVCPDVGGLGQDGFRLRYRVRLYLVPHQGHLARNCGRPRRFPYQGAVRDLC